MNSDRIASYKGINGTSERFHELFEGCFSPVRKEDSKNPCDRLIGDSKCNF